MSRRRMLGVTGAAAAVAAAGPACSAAPSPATPAAGPTGQSGYLVITPDDGRYGYLVARGANRRYVGQPENVRQVFTAEQVVTAVGDAVRARQRIAVRSGGHCGAALVDNPDTRTVIDTSRMTAVTFDPAHRAFSVESGAQLGEVYRSLVLTWNVVLPAGSCPTVGVGGYTAGGGFGPLCREQGLAVDHLYGVEVVTVDGGGTPRLVLATREPDDPNRDLWWAHTGGGGGSFGVVTRYLFRSPSATGSDPSTALPSPPATAVVTTAGWSWAGVDRARFGRLLANHGAWHAAHSAPGTPFAGLYSGLIVTPGPDGQVGLVIDVDGDRPDAVAMTRSYLDAIGAGVGAPTTMKQTRMPWLDAALASLYGGLPSPNNRTRGKGAFLRQALTTEQIDRLHTAFTDPAGGGGQLILYAYGAAINAVAPDATAIPHRDSSVLLYLGAAWADPAQDAAHDTWVRTVYRDLFAGSGGVPVPSAAADGSYVNYPDLDLLDPAWNTSGVGPAPLYFGANLARLQQVKRRYDPGDVFRHPLSIPLPRA